MKDGDLPLEKKKTSWRTEAEVVIGGSDSQILKSLCSDLENQKLGKAQLGLNQVLFFVHVCVCIYIYMHLHVIFAFISIYIYIHMYV